MFSNSVGLNHLNSSPNSLLIDQVYTAPLPDFTVYPEGIEYKPCPYWKFPFIILRLLIWPRGHVIEDEKKLSPFLRMIRNDNSAEIYDNPTIAAVIDSKWKAAKWYFFRHALCYFIFGLIFAIIAIGFRPSDM